MTIISAACNPLVIRSNSMKPVGNPVTAVYADNLSDAAILAAIRAGHVFVDVEGSTTRLIELSARRVTMGDAMTARRGERVVFTLHAAGAAGGKVSLVEDGKPLADAILAGNDERKTFTIAFDGKRHWLRPELRDGLLAEMKKYSGR